MSQGDDIRKTGGGARRDADERRRLDDEKRVAACRNWKIQSPHFDRNAALDDPKTKSWEATLSLSMPKSWAWVEERFPGCRVTPLFAADFRRAQTKVKKIREKKDALAKKKAHGSKDFYSPDDDGVGANS